MVKVVLHQFDREPACGDPDNCCGWNRYISDSKEFDLTPDQFATLYKLVDTDSNGYESFDGQELGFDISPLYSVGSYEVVK